MFPPVPDFEYEFIAAVKIECDLIITDRIVLLEQPRAIHRTQVLLTECFQLAGQKNEIIGLLEGAIVGRDKQKTIRLHDIALRSDSRVIFFRSPPHLCTNDSLRAIFRMGPDVSAKLNSLVCSIIRPPRRCSLIVLLI